MEWLAWLGLILSVVFVSGVCALIMSIKDDFDAVHHEGKYRD